LAMTSVAPVTFARCSALASSGRPGLRPLSISVNRARIVAPRRAAKPSIAWRCAAMPSPLAPCRVVETQDALRPPLRFAETAELDHRHRLDAELACRQHAPVAGDDAVRAVHRWPASVQVDRRLELAGRRRSTGGGLCGCIRVRLLHIGGYAR
jgi:hypothetical protein